MPVQLKRGLAPFRDIAGSLKEQIGETVFVDTESANRMVINRVDRVLASIRSPFQEIEVFHTPHFGLVLALDSIVQVAQSDEYTYHELLVHPACLMIGDIRSALVLGGGDGCAGRELLKYPELETIELVELDQAVIELSREHLRELNGGALDHSGITVVNDEGEHYLLEHPHKRYDFIAADLTEPYDTAGNAGDLSRHIFSQPFYEFIKSHLTDRGIFAIQTGGITYIPSVDKHHRYILEGLRAAFATVATAYFYVHSFDQLWTITLASEYPYDILGFDPGPMIREKGLASLRYYDSISHAGAFQAPRHIRDLLSQESE